MPNFENNPLDNLQFKAGDADEDIDLNTLSKEEALVVVEELLKTAPKDRSYCLRFAAASGDGVETLFQPLGRFLLERRKQKKISRCLPIAEGNGYFISI